MRACPECGHADEALADASSCPACGSVLPAEVEARAEDGAAASAAASPTHERRRLQSSAGVAIPVKRVPSDDAVPAGGGGWMARLEAARSAGVLDAMPELDPSEIESAPPSAAPAPAAPKNGAFQAKPAHLLIAELEADEERVTRERRNQQTREGDAPVSIAELEMPEVPKEVEPKRKLPAWVWMAGLGLVALGVAAVGVKIATSEPPPEPARQNTALEAKLQRAKRAKTALDQGHELALMGPKKADEAIAAYKKALQLEPNLPKAHKGLGAMFAMKKDVKRLLLHYKKYLELEPTAEDADKVRSIIEKYEDDPMRPKRR